MTVVEPETVPAYTPFSGVKVRVVHAPGDDADTAVTFIIAQEDHTIGNALRWIIIQNPEVEYCGYSIPTPFEDVMHMRIQTNSGTAVEAFQKGLEQLIQCCDVLTAKFKHEAQHGTYEVIQEEE
jgi:DNA-directed RNA polymerase I and III subunit RPAC2